MRRHPIYDFFEWCGRLTRSGLSLGSKLSEIHRHHSVHFALFFSFLIQLLLIASTFYAIGSFKTGMLTLATACVQLIALNMMWTQSKDVLARLSEQKAFVLGALVPALVLFVVIWFFLGDILTFRRVSESEYLFSGGIAGFSYLDYHSLNYSMPVPLLGLYAFIKDVSSDSLVATRIPGVFCLTVTTLILSSAVLKSSGFLFHSLLLVLLFLGAGGIWAEFLIGSDVPFIMMFLALCIHATSNEGQSRNYSLFATLAAFFSVAVVIPGILVVLGFLGRQISNLQKRLFCQRSGLVLLSMGLTLFIADRFERYIMNGILDGLSLFEKWEFSQNSGGLYQIVTDGVFWWGGFCLAVFAGLCYSTDLRGVPVRTMSFTFLGSILASLAIYLGVPIVNGDIPVDHLEVISLFILFSGPVVFFANHQFVQNSSRRWMVLGAMLIAAVVTGGDKFRNRTTTSSINVAMAQFQSQSRGGTFVYDVISVDFQSRLMPNYFGTRFFLDSEVPKLWFRSFHPFANTDHRGPLLWPGSNSLIGDLLAGHTPLDVVFLFHSTSRNQTRPGLKCEWFESIDLKCEAVVGDPDLIELGGPVENLEQFEGLSLQIYRTLVKNLELVPENRVHFETLTLLEYIVGSVEKADRLLEVYKKFQGMQKSKRTSKFLDLAKELKEKRRK